MLSLSLCLSLSVCVSLSVSLSSSPSGVLPRHISLTHSVSPNNGNADMFFHIFTFSSFLDFLFTRLLLSSSLARFFFSLVRMCHHSLFVPLSSARSVLCLIINWLRVNEHTNGWMIELYVFMPRCPLCWCGVFDLICFSVSFFLSSLCCPVLPRLSLSLSSFGTARLPCALFSACLVDLFIQSASSPCSFPSLQRACLRFLVDLCLLPSTSFVPSSACLVGFLSFPVVPCMMM